MRGPGLAGGTVASAKPGELALGETVLTVVVSAELDTFTVESVSAVGTAPVPTAIPPPSRARANAAAVTVRTGSDRHSRCVLGRRCDGCGRFAADRSCLRFKLSLPLACRVDNDSAH
jgi:hypothetical protein